MEGDINHGYLQEDMGFDDLINNAGWPGAVPGSQYSYQQQAHAPQDVYPQYQHTNQPSYNHFDLSQQTSYPQVAYSNSPYTSSQYQHARPSDVFGTTSFSLDPSLQSSAPYHGQESSFPFVAQANEHATISPHSLQYSMPSNQPMNRAVSNSPFQQQAVGASNTFSQTAQDASAIYFNNFQNANMQRNQGAPIQYPSLSNGATENEPKPGIKRTFDDITANAARAPQAKLAPPSNPLRVTHPELLAAKDSSSRPRLNHAPYMAWTDEPVQVQLGLKNTLPKYHPRKSRSGRELVPGFDLSRTLTPARVSTKRVRPPKDKTSTLSKWKGTSKASKPVTDKVNNLREDGNSAKPPSTPTETSSEEEDESSSEEESEYEEDEDMPVVDISTVREATRPTKPAAAARWDAIGIIWKDPNTSPTADVVKDAIEKYATFVSALRLQLKTNSMKIEEAAARPAEVNQLRAARRDLLDALYQTIDAAVCHGYASIVENLGGHHKLVNGLTTTLIECIKADDFTGRLPKAVFNLLAKFTTMTDELLKKLKFDSIQKRWNKKGDEETKQKIVTILANTTDAKERAAKAKKAEDEKKAREAIEQTKQRNPEAMKATAANSAKRPYEGDGSNGKPSKKFASDLSGTPGSSIKPNPLKRPTSNLLGIASKPAAKPVVKKREPSPPQESKLGALLASIAKPPEPPKAPAAPPRAPETPEEKARRERKESRRHLRVKFKEGPELEQIRLFKHEQGEDEGRQDDMLRDANDSHNEGMMHKKRVSETIDEGIEEDEYQPPDFEERPYTEPISIDFTPLDKTTIFGPTYNTRGGELTFTTSEQKTQQRREGLELMVIYTDPKDIPPSPKEPSQVDGPGNFEPEREIKAPTEAWLVQRLQEINHYGLEQASQIFVRRQQELLLKETRENRARGIAQSFTPPPSANVSSVLQQLGGQQPSSTQLPQTQARVNQEQTDNMTERQKYENLQALLENIKPLIGKPFPPTEPPEWMTNPVQRAGWIEGYNRDKTTKDQQAAEQRMGAQMQATPYQQPPMAPTQFDQPIPPLQMQHYQPPVPQQITPVQLPDVNQQMQGVLTGYGNGDNNTPASQSFDFNSWAAANNSGPVHASGFPDPTQRPRRDESWNNENTQPKSSRSQNSNAKGRKQRSHDSNSWSDGPLDQNGQYKGKKKPCKYFFEGKCAKGAKCTYLHD